MHLPALIKNAYTQFLNTPVQCCTLISYLHCSFTFYCLIYLKLLNELYAYMVLDDFMLEICYKSFDLLSNVTQSIS